MNHSTQPTALQRKWLKMQMRLRDDAPTTFGLLSLSPVTIITPALSALLGIMILSAMDIFNMGTATFLVGIAVGAFARDVGRFRATCRIWPVWREVVNWEKVDELLSSD